MTATLIPNTGTVEVDGFTLPAEPSLVIAVDDLVLPAPAWMAHSPAIRTHA